MKWLGSIRSVTTLLLVVTACIAVQRKIEVPSWFIGLVTTAVMGYLFKDRSNSPDEVQRVKRINIG